MTLSGDHTPETRPMRGHAIIAGYGPIGRTACEALVTAGVEVVIVELNAHTVETQLGLARTIVHGCVTDEASLREARITEAGTLVLTLADIEPILAAAAVARRLNPTIWIVARVRHLSEAVRAQQAGVDGVVIEEVLAAQRMGEMLTHHLPPHE